MELRIEPNWGKNGIPIKMPGKEAPLTEARVREIVREELSQLYQAPVASDAGETKNIAT